jgi:D-3-phosphoglycerate dehydrogenase
MNNRGKGMSPDGWSVVVTPRSLKLGELGLDRELTDAGCAVTYLAGPLNPSDLARFWAGADGAILGLDMADAAAIQQAPSLKVISRYGVGYDNVDVAAATAAGVLVTRTANAPTSAVAEFTLALIMASARQLPLLSGAHPPARSLGQVQELAAVTLGLVGLGRIGREVAWRASRLGMNVIYCDPAAAENAKAGTWKSYTLERLLCEADIVSLHVPLTMETHRLIGPAELELMKCTAHLINTARGGLIDESALAKALQGGRLAGAALDVRAVEPPPADDPLALLPNVILTPHVASKTLQSIERMAREAVANLLTVKRGELPSAAINPQVARGKCRRDHRWT